MTPREQYDEVTIMSRELGLIALALTIIVVQDMLMAESGYFSRFATPEVQGVVLTAAFGINAGAALWRVSNDRTFVNGRNTSELSPHIGTPSAA
jgi:hypothetical protein